MPGSTFTGKHSVGDVLVLSNFTTGGGTPVISSRFSPEVRDRAVRMVLEQQEKHASQWTAITSIAEKIGCTPETLRSWVRQAERDQAAARG